MGAGAARLIRTCVLGPGDETDPIIQAITADPDGDDAGVTSQWGPMAETFARTVESHRLLARSAFIEALFDPGVGGGNVVVRAVVRCAGLNQSTSGDAAATNDHAPHAVATPPRYTAGGQQAPSVTRPFSWPWCSLVGPGRGCPCGPRPRRPRPRDFRAARLAACRPWWYDA